MSLSRLWTAFLFSVSILFLASGLYFVFDQSLGSTGDEIVKAWYYGEMVNLQEGQVLSAIAKNQSLLQNSPYIKAVVLVDVKDPERPLFAIGELSHPISTADLQISSRSAEKLTRLRSGFLADIIMARLPGNNNLVITYEVTSRFLIWSYFLALAIGILFVVYLMGITLRISNIERRKRESLRTDLLARLSHDLGSPLLAISSLSLEIKKIDIKLHQRLEQTAQSIRSLLSQTNKTDKKLMKDSPTVTAAIDDERHEVPILAVLKDFMIIKRAELSGYSGLSLDFEISEGCQDLFVKINLNDFKRHLSNIFKNSVEATESCAARNIKLNVARYESDVTLSITDSGCGIPQDRLQLIGGKGVSLKGGEGLGLHFVIESVRHWQGTFKIESELGVGTKITITLPIVETPHWFISKLSFVSNKKMIFIDDDISMMARWKSRRDFQDINFLEFNTADQFRRWFHGGGQLEDDLRFIFDFHLDGENTGLALIDELGIAKESTLVTSAYLDESILTEATRFNVQVLPKVLV